MNNQFYKSPQFIASAVILFIFLIDIVPFTRFSWGEDFWGGTASAVGLTGFQTINSLKEASAIYYLFYLIPLGAAYLIICPFIKDPNITRFQQPARMAVFLALVGFGICKVANIGEVHNILGDGVKGLGVGYYFCLVSSLFLPFEKQMMTKLNAAKSAVGQKMDTQGNRPGGQP